jgi:hypothetical protein
MKNQGNKFDRKKNFLEIKIMENFQELDRRKYVMLKISEKAKKVSEINSDKF